MSANTPELFANLQRQRSSIVQGFLWILLGVVCATFVLNAVLLGPQILTLAGLGPNLLFLALLGAALWFNRRHEFQLAVGLVVGVTLIASVVPLLILGIAGNVMSMFMLFVPMVLAGLLLSRRTLYITAAVTLTAVLAAPALHGAALALGVPAGPDGAWPIALQFALVYAIVTFLVDRFGLVLHQALRRSAEQESAQRERDSALVQTREALVERESFNEAILENLPGIFYVVDESGSYLQWNRNFIRTLGYEPHEMSQLSPVDLFEGDDRDLIVRRMADVFEHGYAATEAHVRTKDGRRIPYFFNGTRVTLGGKPYLAGIGVDRSALDAANTRVRELNEELIERLERLRALRDIDRAITGSRDFAHTLNVILEQVTSRLRVDAAAMLLYQPGSQTLRFGASRGFRTAPSFLSELRLGQGLAGRAGLEREVAWVTDPEEFRRTFTRFGSVRNEGFNSYFAIPLVSKGQLQGVLELFHRAPLEPDADWKDFMTALATQAALALDNAALLENLERSNTELRLAYDTTIEGWARALDLKDEESAGHSQRVTELTLELARRMGVPDEELEHVRRGALLHDMGKMGVPDEILLKPGKLTDAEWAVMRQHTVFAHDFLAPIPFLRPALDIPYCHHEKWDGSGYPRGLEGEEIPLSARVFAVVDVFDALTSNRPYREAWSVDRALAHIREASGTHFEPAVVGAFLELMEGAAA